LYYLTELHTDNGQRRLMLWKFADDMMGEQKRQSHVSMFNLIS
jgi:hypothetical protein